MRTPSKSLLVKTYTVKVHYCYAERVLQQLFNVVYQFFLSKVMFLTFAYHTLTCSACVTASSTVVARQHLRFDLTAGSLKSM